MEYLPNILFAILLLAGIGFFTRNIKRLSRNIKLGKALDVSDNAPTRWSNMAKIALGQTKMVVRPIAGLLHVIVYLGFIIINIEVLEIILDGILGTHRIFAPLGTLYDILIASFEILAFLVIVAVIAFWVRRNMIKLRRFLKPEMKGWPKKDGNLILYIELILMVLFLTMNAADYQLQLSNIEQYTKAGVFPISQFISPVFEGMTTSSLIVLERLAWWLHIAGILFFFELFILFQALTYFIGLSEHVLRKLETQRSFQES